jgi:hypothetical protein
LRQNASDEFRRLLKSLDASNDYFVFLMKPSGLELARSLLSIAVKSGFEVGYDALEEDETLVRR